MKDVAIVGLAGSGKSTIFTAVSGQSSTPGTAAQAVVAVPDERLGILTNIYESVKTTHAQVRFVDVAGLDPHSIGAARVADALAIVLRAFGPDVDVERDLSSFRAELAVADVATIEKVLERTTRKARNDAQVKAENEIAQRAEAVLAEDRWLSEEPWTPEEARAISMWGPLTVKPALYVVNADEDATGIELPNAVTIRGRLEAELAELSDDEAHAFLEEFGVTELASGRLVHAIYRTLGLVTFFTAGPTESRAWEVKAGSKAPQAAGVIHSDFEEKFIRAERVGYDDIVECGSEDAARSKGLLRAEGKDYEVKEGDVLLILHGA